MLLHKKLNYVIALNLSVLFHKSVTQNTISGSNTNSTFFRWNAPYQLLNGHYEDTKMEISRNAPIAKLGDLKSKITPKWYEASILSSPLVEVYSRECLSTVSGRTSSACLRTTFGEYFYLYHPTWNIPSNLLHPWSEMDSITTFRQATLFPGMSCWRCTLNSTQPLLHGSNSCASIPADIRSVSLYSILDNFGDVFDFSLFCY